MSRQTVSCDCSPRGRGRRWAGLPACGRSGGSKAAAPASASAKRLGLGSATSCTRPGPGDFGTPQGDLRPGNATGATARGVTDTEIHLSTMGDPANTVIPGAGQESFDVGQAFVELVQRGGRHPRPQDRADQARRQALQHRRSGDQRLPDRLHAGRQREPARRRRRQAAAGLQPRADPGLRQLTAGGRGRRAGRHRQFGAAGRPSAPGAPSARRIPRRSRPFR